MLPISLLLHLHQPPTQFPEVLRRVIDQCYRPLVSLLGKYPQAHLTINLTRSLIEQLESAGAAAGIIKPLKEAVGRGQVEITGTAAYHVLLPKLPKEEVVRQIELNEETLSKYLGVVGPIKGFFPPEMGIDQPSAKLLGELGYQWVIVDEGAIPHLRDRSIDELGRTFRCKDFDNPLLVVRNKELSLKLAFGVITSLKEFLMATKPYALYPNPSLVLALDGETFGHHQPALMPFLEELMNKSGVGDYRLTTISEMVNKKIRGNQFFQSVKISSSTWSNDWLKWDNPENELHKLQWQLTDLAIKTVVNSKFSAQGGSAFGGKSQKAWLKARTLLDRALHSDQYWWASLRPNWHYQIVARGARLLRDAVLEVPDASAPAKLTTSGLYEKITKTGLEKYGEAVIV